MDDHNQAIRSTLPRSGLQSGLCLVCALLALPVSAGTLPSRPQQVTVQACQGDIENALGQFIARENWRIRTLMVDTWRQLEPPCAEDAPARTVDVPADRDPFTTVTLLVSAHEQLRGSTLFEVEQVDEDIVVRQVTNHAGEPADGPWSHTVHLPTVETGAADALRAILAQAPGQTSTSLDCVTGTPSCPAGVPLLNGVNVSYPESEPVDFARAVQTIVRDTGDRHHWLAHVDEDGTWTLSLMHRY